MSGSDPPEVVARRELKDGLVEPRSWAAALKQSEGDPTMAARLYVPLRISALREPPIPITPAPLAAVSTQLEARRKLAARAIEAEFEKVGACPELWSKALASANGDPRSARVAYVALRVEEKLSIPVTIPEPTGRSAGDAPGPVSALPSAPLSSPLPLPTETELYARAMNEIVAGSADPGIWAKAFALADGDEARTKAAYLRLRVEANARQAVPPMLVPKQESTDQGTSRQRSKTEEDFPSAPTSSQNVTKSSNRWSWIWAWGLGVLVGKLFGLVGALVVIGSYYALQPKLGTGGAVATSVVIGVVAAIALNAMLRV